MVLPLNPNKFAPHLEGIHYMAYRTNLSMRILSQIHVVKCIEELIQSLDSFFSCNSKMHIDFSKMLDLMKAKGNKIL